MINFKKIELQDKRLIDNIFVGNRCRTCDFCFGNLYAWNSKFNTEYAIEQGTIYLRFKDDDNSLYYMMPMGKTPIKEAMLNIMADADSRRIPFRMKGVTAEMWKKIESAMPGQFEYIIDRKNYEYIYLSEKLIHLTGKKLQSKRNHINRFKRDYPNWCYFPLTTQKDIDDCISMLDEWEAKNTDKSNNSLNHEYIAIKKMLDNFEYLELKGGAIRVNGKVIAFTIGEQLIEDTFVVHVEKAFSDMNGAYTIINQQFIECEAAKYKYVNREEDMGLESLRKAKESYQPDILLQEGVVKPIVR